MLSAKPLHSHLLIMDSTQHNNNVSIDNNTQNPTLIGAPEGVAHDTIRFTHEGELTSIVQQNTVVGEDLFDVIGDPVSHEIADFCSRPYALSDNRSWKSADNVGSTIFRVNTTSFREAPVWDKLKGFYAFSATFCFKVVFNAQPTQSGALLISFRPGVAPLSNIDGTQIPPAFCLPELSGLPNVLVNLASSSEANLKVGYRRALPLCPVSMAGPEFGEYKISVVCRLRGATNGEEIPFKCYMWLEDLKTYGTSTYKTIQLQGHKAPAATVEAKKKSGPISSVADTVADISNALTAIPGVADIAGPVSWAARGVSTVASMFGYSKPHDPTPSAAMTINPYKDFAHGEGASATATKLTISDNQAIKMRPIGSTPEDEMSINYIVSRPIIVGTFPWKKGTREEQSIFHIDVGPRSVYGSVDIGNKRYMAADYVNYLSRLFRYWRGTFLYTFTICTTKFHSGRLRFVFNPALQKAPAASDIPVQYQHTYSHIVDIRDANTITLKIPFVSLTPFLDIDQGIGTLSVFVEAPLVSNSTASSDIDIVVSRSGCDWCFAGPSLARDDQNCRSMNVPLKEIKPKIQLQGFTNNEASDAPAVIDITNSETTLNTMSALQQTIGDPVVSLRTLAKRFTYNSHLVWEKDCLLGIQCNSLLKDLIGQNFTSAGDFIDWISLLYAFRTGGMRFCLHGQNIPNTSYKFVPYDRMARQMKNQGITQGSIISFKEPIETYRKVSDFVEVPYSQNITGALVVEVPYYSIYPVLENKRHVLNWTDNDGKPALPITYDGVVGAETDSSRQLILFAPNTTADTKVDLYRAGADDFNCGFLMGPPIIFEYTR
uniref:Structural polyprotein n=1 Tax=Rodent dicistro-like virus TaxID=2864002 RepID=A0A8K1HGN8_9VIRU|nr:structural polyprotein [Rodent dicistro-like virus]